MRCALSGGQLRNVALHARLLALDGGGRLGDRRAAPRGGARIPQARRALPAEAAAQRGAVEMSAARPRRPARGRGAAGRRCRRARRPLARRRVQRATLRLSQAHDPSEREAEQIARQVDDDAASGALAARRGSSCLPPAPRRAPRRPEACRRTKSPPSSTAEIKAELGGGQPLLGRHAQLPGAAVQGELRRGSRSIPTARPRSIATRLGASAFTFGRDIFFADGRYQPDSPAGMELLAHELTHTIQQREVVQRQLAPAAARSTSSSRSAPRPRSSAASSAEALDWIADKANIIPGYPDVHHRDRPQPDQHGRRSSAAARTSCAR